jgi:uncharacterized protein YbaR (Trm112 family)
MIDGYLLELLRCAECGHHLEMDGDTLVCTECSHSYGVFDDIPLLIPNSAKPTHKGREAIANENSVLTNAPFRDLERNDRGRWLSIVPLSGGV